MGGVLDDEISNDILFKILVLYERLDPLDGHRAASILPLSVLNLEGEPIFNAALDDDSLT